MAYRPNLSILSGTIVRRLTQTSVDLSPSDAAKLATELTTDPTGLGFKSLDTGQFVGPREIANRLNSTGRTQELLGDVVLDALDVAQSLAKAAGQAEKQAAPVAQAEHQPEQSYGKGTHMAQLNVASQLLGSAKGHAVNSAVDKVVDAPAQSLVAGLEKLGMDFAKSQAASEMQSLGYAPTLQGAAQLIDDKLDGAVAASGLSDAAKADLKAVIDSLFAIVEGKLPQVSL